MYIGAAAQRDCPRQNVLSKGNNREDYKMAEAVILRVQPQ